MNRVRMITAVFSSLVLFGTLVLFTHILNDLTESSPLDLSTTNNFQDPRDKLSLSIPDNTFVEDLRFHRNFRLLPSFEECGNKKKRTKRMLKGNFVKESSYPWMVRIFSKVTNDSNPESDIIFGCGGTIINKRYVLTAGHCKRNNISFEPYGVIIGNKNGNGLVTPEERDQMILIEEFIRHPNFSGPAAMKRQRRRNDIALIRLKNEIPSEDYNPICLPIQTQNFPNELKNFNFSTGNLMNNENEIESSIKGLPLMFKGAGWGITAFGKNDTNEKLLEGSFKIKDLMEECLKIMTCTNRKSKKKSRPVFYPDEQICGQEIKGGDFMEGDSGGPLIYEHEKEGNFKSFQVAIMMFGFNFDFTNYSRSCVENNTIEYSPGIFVNVQFYLNWILENINP